MIFLLNGGSARGVKIKLCGWFVKDVNSELYECKPSKP